MKNTVSNLYQDIAERTGGHIYLGIVGPVRTGKSTFVKRFMETLVLPNISDPYLKERARDELPQSGSGKTIMTSEPKFVPEEAVSITPDDRTSLSIRLIDSVGYMIPGAIGAEEDGKPRMVTTPWFPDEIPMTKAAELGTKKIMDEHCSIGIVITTDGSIHDIPRADFLDAERSAIEDMIATGKPYVVLVNSVNPEGASASQIKADIQSRYSAPCICVNCLCMEEEVIGRILREILFEFPLNEVHIYLPKWLDTLPWEQPLKATIYEEFRKKFDSVRTLREAEEALSTLQDLPQIELLQITKVNPGTGSILCVITFKSELYYDIISESTGFDIHDEGELLSLLKTLSKIKKEYDRVSDALSQVQATGYGIVMPTPEEMHLEVPEIVRKGSNYGVRLKASAPSIHMMRADIETEISPIVGDEKQSEDLLHYLLQEYEGDTAKLWDSNIFGKSVFELVTEGLGTKLRRMPEESRYKLQSTLSRVINEGSSGLICIILG